MVQRCERWYMDVSEGGDPVLEYLAEALEEGETLLQHVRVRRRFGLLADLGEVVVTLLSGAEGRGYHRVRIHNYLALTDRRFLLVTVDRVMRPHLIETAELPLREIQGLELRRNLITFWSWTLRIDMLSRIVKLVCYWPWNTGARRLLKELSSRTGILVKGLEYG